MLKKFKQSGTSRERQPLVLEPRTSDDILAAVMESKSEIKQLLFEVGAVLFRGFSIGGEGALPNILDALDISPINYIYRSTPRSDVGAGVYTATEYPAALSIPMHSENAYQRDWPMVIAFHCITAAEQGGATPISPVAKVTRKIGDALIAEFRDRKVAYVRNYSDFIDLPWQVVFQCSDRSVVEEYCKKNEIEFQWKNGGLRTRQVCQGTAIHPGNGTELWFNQVQLFHVASLGEQHAREMIRTFGIGDLPRHAYFGDGGDVPADLIARIRKIFEEEKIRFVWQKNDILLLDNMQFAHGRDPFRGHRRILTSMGSPRSSFV